KHVLLLLNDSINFRGLHTVRAADGKVLTKTWSARDGATEPYRDVFTGVFRENLPVSGL
ncbi:unnamed protein product, partial [Ectocarpus sp. 12 AP-2014]